ncbi:glycoside hydrolase family 88 protein [Saccharicrinis fermentans]|uniref:Unsaturated rhamnogalacturonyl hydrolase YteR n=1 Tax=Saccharicrinis fermentans DSM 9555 = JCM 21142 TaxID=869213 RepID=W7YCE1_9BACT|nr:glycoside hydrolase family 88 protein [Saccharicrinis fermentans]GAF02111.1 unsaturated rhamnogalacturonyl hydrolase YteR [Saccharicrinis fermentans DSM 9555 = JCM 21142]
MKSAFMNRHYFNFFKYILICSWIIFHYSHSAAQEKKEKRNKKRNNIEASISNDANTPLHLTKPNYPISYATPSSAKIESQMESILAYLSSVTPTTIIDSKTQQILSNFENINQYSYLKHGEFRLTSYEWGVTYAGMIRMAQVTENEKYLNYVTERFSMLSEVAPYYKAILKETGKIDPSITTVLQPKALDDAGAMCAAMIKTSTFDQPNSALDTLIGNYMDYIMYHQYRLKDGTFARNRPQYNTVWLDDMFMSIPAILQMGQYKSDNKYIHEAIHQIKLFKDKMFMDEEGLFRHGWIEGLQPQPSYCWARANGWALLTLCEALDVLPENHKDRPWIKEIYKKQITSLAKYQSGQGLWHQLINKPDSYLETSASAIFVYAIAHGINQGWLNAQVYGPIVSLGWSALSEKVNTHGQVNGTCVGTGMGFDPAFYYYRPTSTQAAHGYGPMLLAGAEMIELCKNWFPKKNDSAIHFYAQELPYTEPIFKVGNPRHPPYKKAGSSRKGNNPVVFIIGDSTVKNGRDRGDGGQWGWASFFDHYFDTTKITIENHALGGISSRTFFTYGLWQDVLEGFKEGDYLFIQFGHNDVGSFDTGRARASIKGAGEESKVYVMENTRGPETVYTFGHYIRLFIKQAQAQGVTVIALSHTPRNNWKDGKMARVTDTYAKWTKQAAQAQGAFYIDANNLCASAYEKIGQAATMPYYKDNVHTSYKGAILNGNTIAQAVYKLHNCRLKQYLKLDALDNPPKVAPSPLFRDKQFDGAADPVVIWNKAEKKWFMFYTNRRAKLKNNKGLEWVHGTPIGIAESEDGGLTWKYRSDAKINYGGPDITYWAPEVIEHDGKYHMFLTVVPGIFTDWNHPRHIIHLTSNNLIDWNFQSKLNLASDKVIDAEVIKAPNGKWRMYYNNEQKNKSIYYAESSNLLDWENKGLAVNEKRGEGPVVFYWKNRYFMIIDSWKGLSVFSSKNMKNWYLQKENILEKPGYFKDDGVKGGHADVIINNDRAYIFYFTHPGRTNDIWDDTYETRRSSIQVRELKFINHQIVCNRNLPVNIELIQP